MRILTVGANPFHVLNYAVRSGTTALPFHLAAVDSLPSSLEAIIATGDLQSATHTGDRTSPPKLLVEVLAAEIATMQAHGQLPPREQTAIILTGDLQPRADEADVQDAWFALTDTCRWIAGVAGNHDAFGGSTQPAEARRILNRPGLWFLDDDARRVDGLRVAGLSGIIGKSGSAWARSEEEYARAMRRLATAIPDLLISHDGPNVAGTALPGWPSVRRALEAGARTIVVRGHDAWPPSLATLRNGTQVLNVAERVIVLRAYPTRRAATFTDQNDHNPLVLQDCPACHGRGTVGQYEYRHEEYAEVHHMIECTACGASGLTGEVEPYFADDRPELEATTDAEGWLTCPRCRWRFTMRDKNAWTGNRHLRCGQKIKMVGKER